MRLELIIFRLQNGCITNYTIPLPTMGLEPIPFKGQILSLPCIPFHQVG
jgi:hypothetical protein